MILDGMRVLDFTQYLAGPTATRLMAEIAERLSAGHASAARRTLEAECLAQRRAWIFAAEQRARS